jgi:glycerol-3-phosphate dehydrogenase (NAD(P)+)
MLASELSQSMGGAAVAASKDVKARNAVARLFENTALHVATSGDVHGVALAGILKNVYAIVLGAADGMGNGYNAKGFLFGTAQSEMAEMLPLLGGARKTAGIPALAGDLLATGMSSTSNNHAFGASLASSRAAQCGAKTSFFAEGMVAAPFIAKRLGRHANTFPLFEIALALVEYPKEGIKKLDIFLFGKAKRKRRNPPQK